MRVRVLRVLLAAILISGSPACRAANPANIPAQSNAEGFKAAYRHLLEYEKCLDRAPDAHDPRLVGERRRTADLIRLAQAKGLQAHLDGAAAEWRRTDSLADKVCYFQIADFKGTSPLLVREANDRFELAVGRL